MYLIPKPGDANVSNATWRKITIKIAMPRRPSTAAMRAGADGMVPILAGSADRETRDHSSGKTQSCKRHTADFGNAEAIEESIREIMSNDDPIQDDSQRTGDRQ